MTEQSPQPITALLRRAASGDPDAEQEFATAVYRELRRMAARYMRAERQDHTLQPTALVHEAFLRLVDQKNISWQNRAHFYGVAANVMRHVLIDHARRARADKRAGQLNRVSFNEDLLKSDDSSIEFLALNEALERLNELDPREHTIVMLRFFAGFRFDEIAHMLGISLRTAKSDWKLARVWLRKQLEK
jgi:RNA polymerase sigma-70 factor (ECF subfamily)